MFSLDKVKDIETKLKIDGEIPKVEAIRGKDLMIRWEMHEAEIYSITFKHGLDIVEPFGHSLKFDLILNLIVNGTLNLSDVLFKLSDIIDFESEYPEVVPDKADDKEPEKKKRQSQIHKEKCREMAKKLWQEDPTLTIVDMAYKNEINALFDGKPYTEKTIRKWIKDLNPNQSPGRRPKKK